MLNWINVPSNEVVLLTTRKTSVRVIDPIIEGPVQVDVVSSGEAMQTHIQLGGDIVLTAMPINGHRRYVLRPPRGTRALVTVGFDIVVPGVEVAVVVTPIAA